MKNIIKTKRKKAAPNKSESQLASFIQLIDNIVILLSHTFIIKDLNQTAESFYNWEKTGVRGKSFIKLCTKNHILPILTNYLTTTATKDLTNNTIKENHIEWTFQPINFNADYINYILIGQNQDTKDNSSLPPKQDALPKKTRKAEKTYLIKSESIAKVFRKITGQASDDTKTIEEQIQSMRAYYESIIAHLPGNVYWMDTNSIYLGCNDNVAKMLGLKSRSDIVGKTYEDQAEMGNWSNNQAKSFRKDDLMVIATGKPKLNVEEPPLPHATTGKLTYYLTSRVPLKNEKNKVIGIIGISIDITARKIMEEQLRETKEAAEAANKAKSEFLAVMSHELRTPLNGIIGSTQALKITGIKQNQKVPVNDIYLCAHILLSHINDILDLTKLESGKLEVKPNSFDLKLLISEVKAATSPMAQQKQLDVEINYPNGVPTFVVSDRRHIRQILTNLTSNAIKYTEKGKVTIDIDCLQNDNKKGLFKFSVKDTGFGIPTDKLDFVFGKFNQLDPAYKSRYRGTGLGLAIVKELIDTMNGEIHAESEEGKGSNFWFTLTLDLQEANTSAIKWPTQYEKIRLLVVNDNADEGLELLQQIATSGSRTVPIEQALKTLEEGVQEVRYYDVVIFEANKATKKLLALTAKIHSASKFNKPALLLLSNNKIVCPKDFVLCAVKSIKPAKLVKLLTKALEKREKLLGVEATKKLKGAKILLVEDNVINQKITRALIENFGCKVDIAEDAEVAFALLKNKKYAVILMDIGLPSIDGYTAAGIIKKENRKNKNTPIIAMTAHAFDSDRVKCKQAGMEDIVTKPIDINTLKLCLIHWIKK
jgi:two-component system, sensor histidine kinase and response regulator